MGYLPTHPWWAAQLVIHDSRSRLLGPPLTQLSYGRKE